MQIGCAFVLAALLAGAAPAAAQQPVSEPSTGEGVAHVTGWPAFLHAEAPLPEGADTLSLVPAVDTLTLRYRYAADVDAPRMTFALACTPGRWAVRGGERVRYTALDAPPRLAALELRADVVVGGRAVTDVVVVVDSAALGPAPDTLRFDAVGLTYANAFAGTSARVARRYFEDGFRPENLEILRAAFVEGADRRPGPAIGYPHPRPRRPVYVPDPGIGIWIGGIFRPDPPRRPPDRGEGDYAPRGDTVGRSAGETGETGRSSGRRGERADPPGDDERAVRGEAVRGRSGDEGDDDDEEKESLAEEALIAASIVGLVAYGGGTVGYFGSTEAPLGLTAGRVYPQGGLLLQAGVNPAVLTSESEQPDRLAVRLLGFYDLFGLPVQPAAGLGVVLTGREQTEVAPSLSVGAAGNFGRVVVLGGYDVLRGAATFGLAVNFRFRSEPEREREPVVAER